MNLLQGIVDEQIKHMANAKGITVEKCRKDMEFAIEQASICPSSLFTETFGDSVPSVEEFIINLLFKVGKEADLFEM